MRSRGGRIAFTIILLAVVAAAVHLVLRSPSLAGPLEAQAIGVKRMVHHAIYSWGFDLPGTPDLDNLDARLTAAGVKRGTPIFIRIFKREFLLELWMQKNGKFERFATYPICRWSGTLGPKLKTGDAQAPEGFYTVDVTQLNPQSRWHRSFNLGFPNAYDRSQGRTGSFLMVHGGCGSVGCYAMTNAVVDEIWALVESALKQGQKRFQVQVFPFRLSEAELAAHASHPFIGFWREMKAGYDMFEAERIPPKVRVCHGRYEFQPVAGTSDGSTPIETACR